MDSQKAQDRYQVRFDWGADGARETAGTADVVVWVDVVGNGPAPPVATLAAAASPVMVISGDFRNCRAVADWILARQVAKGDRVAVAVVASGATRADGSRRFAVEDFLASGAIVDALSTLGIDYCSPEAAAACAAFTGLRSAVAHVLTASESGAEVEASERTSLRVLGTMNCSTEVRELTE